MFAKDIRPAYTGQFQIEQDNIRPALPVPKHVECAFAIPDFSNINQAPERIQSNLDQFYIIDVVVDDTQQVPSVIADMHDKVPLK
jgi:hypothetical protein